MLELGVLLTAPVSAAAPEPEPEAEAWSRSELRPGDGDQDTDGGWDLVSNKKRVLTGTHN